MSRNTRFKRVRLKSRTPCFCNQRVGSASDPRTRFTACPWVAVPLQVLGTPL